MTAEDQPPPGRSRCIACRTDYDPCGPGIHLSLDQFDGWCICDACVAHARAADDLAYGRPLGGDRPPPHPRPEQPKA